MKSLLRAALLAALMCGAHSLSATTITITDGGTACESALRLTDPSPCGGGGFADLAQTVADGDSVTFDGAGTLLGWVLDTASAGPSFADAAKLVLAKRSVVSFALSDTDPGFDGTFSLAIFAPAILDASSDPLSYTLNPGSYAFLFDAAAPDTVGMGTSTEYQLSVLPVPLMATGLMLLSGLALMGLVFRRQ